MATEKQVIPNAVYFALKATIQRMKVQAGATQFKSDAQVGLKQAAEIEQWLLDKSPA